VKKILIHQANGKMDEAILAALYELYGIEPPPDVMPMTISWLGNSSVATVPTLLDLIVKGRCRSIRSRPATDRLRLGRRRDAHQRGGVSLAVSGNRN
jgi:3-oxoacyl-[acyl-carrier-protein] synthase-3